MYRHSSFDHWCRVRYRVQFQLGDIVYQSDIIDQLLDAKGYGDSYPIRQTSLFANLNSRYPLKVSISLLSMWPVTTVDLIPTSRHKSAARCYDTDKQQWVVETDILGRQLKLRLFYSDVKNVPRHFTRLVSWNAYVVPCEPDRPVVKAVNGPFTNYYSQKEQDEGFDVEMDLPVEEICDNSGGYTERETGYLTAQIEWLYSHLLYQDFYHHYDDVTRLHKHQMR
uniref:DUF2071 domain-containing protein n=1 Tax=Macrostomum lignano TaxID=282301 RepID=A0A1I8H549_9PLAT